MYLILSFQSFIKRYKQNKRIFLLAQCGDENCEPLVSVLKEVVHSLLPSFPSSLTLDKYISPNYMGLFLTEHQEDLIKKLAMSFVKEASHLCSLGEVASKALHLTLAYQFPLSQFPRLEALVEAVDQRAPATWEVRLYSRDTRIHNNEKQMA
ncbi:Protein UBASH3A [Portunus trituberculatus]|uniref:Protein UBASH3A n=1 Tax=Portunus trituberculatus TaxID=210409 RepID=A0A5B7GQA4_PORTR|nr:Protein UBASH3A [Portunus trituberculatus]